MTVTKYHLSASGQMAPCEAKERACPRPGHIDLNDQNTWDNMFAARANVSPKYTPRQNMDGVQRHLQRVEYLATKTASRRILTALGEGQRLKLAKFLDQVVRETPTTRQNAQTVFDHLLADGYVDYVHGAGVTKRDPKQHRATVEAAEVPEAVEEERAPDLFDLDHPGDGDDAELAEHFASQATRRRGETDDLVGLL